LFVRKVGNVDRNFERLNVLGVKGYPVPKIYKYVTGEKLDMEYIHGLDMVNYLLHGKTFQLQKFIFDLLERLEDTTFCGKDYTQIYQQKLDWLPKHFLFKKEELIKRLPKVLPQSLYHGDLTLENIIYTDSGFHLIDPVTIEYDSFIFDIAKLRQDLVCGWFIRNIDVRLETKLQIIDNDLIKAYPEACDNSLLILMLLRVLKHCETGDTNYHFLMKEIERLWKS
jgi:tRNA A-37 threonylcarbamoyl transferase component Bud32